MYLIFGIVLALNLVLALILFVQRRPLSALLTLVVGCAIIAILVVPEVTSHSRPTFPSRHFVANTSLR